MTEPHPPAIDFGGRTWSREELSALAARWYRELERRLGPSPPLVALVMANHPESVAVFFALTCFRAPVVLLADDARAWRSSPPVPVGTPVVLTEATRDLRGSVAAMGCQPLAVTAGRRARPEAPSGAPFLTGPGLVGFTGGTTGSPKPVYRSMRSALRHSAVVAEILGLRDGDGIVAALPLSSFHGLGDTLLLASLLDGPLGLLPRFDHRAVLRMFAMERYRYFAATPMMIDLLGRCALADAAPPGPPLVKVAGGPQPASVFAAFRDRFGTPPRPAYGTSETGIISADTGPPERVRLTAVGRAAPDVRIAIGDAPEAPAPPGVPGRVWVSTPRYMEGYGFPPALEPHDGRGEWRPTQDRGMIDTAGYLTLLGRLDDTFKTPTGQLVDPWEVTEILRRLPGVGDAVVIPLPAASGAVPAAVVAAEAGVEPTAVRWHAARYLPRWAQPQAVLVVKELPRLANGKVDRRVCMTLFERAVKPSTDGGAT